MKNNRWISSGEESPRLPRPNALLLSWMEMERNQKCLSLALERNNSVRWNTNRPSLPPADEPWLHKHTRVVWIWLSHIMEKWIMNIPPETEPFRRRGFQMCWFHCFTRARKRWQASRSTRHLWGLTDSKTWEIINTSLLLMERNVRLCSSARSRSHKITSTLILTSERQQNPRCSGSQNSESAESTAALL